MNFFDNYIINFERARRKIIFLGNFVDSLYSLNLYFLAPSASHMRGI